MLIGGDDQVKSAARLFALFDDDDGDHSKGCAHDFEWPPLPLLLHWRPMVMIGHFPRPDTTSLIWQGDGLAAVVMVVVEYNHDEQ